MQLPVTNFAFFGLWGSPTNANVPFLQVHKPKIAVVEYAVVKNGVSEEPPVENVVYGCSLPIFILEINRSVILIQALGCSFKVIVSFCQTMDPIRGPPFSIFTWDRKISILGCLW